MTDEFDRICERYGVAGEARETGSRFWRMGVSYATGKAAAEIARLAVANVKLAGAIDMVRETLDGGNVQNLRVIINAALEENRRALEDSSDE